jgi:hypothetical protein
VEVGDGGEKRCITSENEILEHTASHANLRLIDSPAIRGKQVEGDEYTSNVAARNNVLIAEKTPQL